jgi:hypothetical protein
MDAQRLFKSFLAMCPPLPATCDFCGARLSLCLRGPRLGGSALRCCRKSGHFRMASRNSSSVELDHTFTLANDRIASLKIQ